MSSDAIVSGATAIAQSGAVLAPHATNDVAAAKKAAKQFEAVLVSQMLSGMFEGIPTDGPFGGGEGEAMFRSLLLDEYGKQIVQQGGFGLSNAIVKSLLKHQEQVR